METVVVALVIFTSCLLLSADYFNDANADLSSTNSESRREQRREVRLCVDENFNLYLQL